MSVAADAEIDEKDKMHLANAFKKLAHVGCAGCSYCVVIKFGPGPGLLSRVH